MAREGLAVLSAPLIVSMVAAVYLVDGWTIGEIMLRLLILAAMFSPAVLLWNAMKDRPEMLRPIKTGRSLFPRFKGSKK